MKKTMMAIAAAATAATALFAQEKPWPERAEQFRHLTISEKCSQESWNRNSSTNGVKVLVCSDSSLRNVFIFREFEFDKDGRLVSISGVKSVRFNGYDARTISYDKSFKKKSPAPDTQKHTNSTAP